MRRTESPQRCYHGPRQLKAVANRSPPLAAAVAMARNKGESFENTAQGNVIYVFGNASSKM